MARNDGQKSTSNRGFASMDTAKQRQIASKGGQSVPPEKRSFSQDPQLAAKAGRKGGESVPPEGRSFSQNRALAAEAGRKGGQARGRAHAQRQPNTQAGSSSYERQAMNRPSEEHRAHEAEPERERQWSSPGSQRIASDESEAVEEMESEEDKRERETEQREHRDNERQHRSS